MCFRYGAAPDNTLTPGKSDTRALQLTDDSRRRPHVRVQAVNVVVEVVRVIAHAVRVHPDVRVARQPQAQRDAASGAAAAARLSDSKFGSMVCHTEAVRS